MTDRPFQPIQPVLNPNKRIVLVGSPFNALDKTDDASLLKALMAHRHAVDYQIQLTRMDAYDEKRAHPSAPSVKSVHMSHCNQGEYEGSCKYGDVNCPAELSVTIVSIVSEQLPTLKR